MRRWRKMLVPALLATFVVQPLTYAETLDELQQQQQQTETKKGELNESIEQKEQSIDEASSKIDTLTEKVEALSAQITQTAGQITRANEAIAKTEREIAELQQSIDTLAAKIAERDQLLADRARAIQVGGTVSYIDVILGASSFADLIDRFTAVNTLIEADRNIMQEQQQDKATIETQKEELELAKEQQQEQKAELVQLNEELTTQKVANNEAIDALEAEQARLYEEKSMLETEYSEALTLSNELERAIIAEQARLAEEARLAAEQRAKEEAERLAQQQAAEQANATSSVTGSLVQEAQVETAAPALPAGTWIRPAAGRFTSGFGWRDIGSGPEYHYGIDIANSVGTPIYAAAGGEITYASTMGGYGNVIMMVHTIDGETFSSVYAHLSAFSVSVGDTVSAGQQIGKMGNTGRSTGPHLHFEIHTGPWRGQKEGVVNPLRYISL